MAPDLVVLRAILDVMPVQNLGDDAEGDYNYRSGKPTTPTWRHAPDTAFRANPKRLAPKTTAPTTPIQNPLHTV